MNIKKNRNSSAKIVFFIFAFVIMAILFNVVYLGATGVHLISGDNIAEYASSRGGGRKVTTLYAKRGSIYSSDNEVIASDVTKYKLVAILSSTRVKANGEPAYVVDKEKTAKKLAPIIGMDEDKVYERLNKSGYQVEFGSYGNNLSSLTKDEIDALELPGLEFEELTSRNYRFGDFASYEVGFVQLSKDEDNQTLVGQMGIEQVYNELLTGMNGKKTYFVDNNNYMLPNGLISEELPVSGNDVYLTLDSDIQIELDMQLKDLAKTMKIDKGTCAVMEAKTGRILAVSNYPSFDSNTKDIENYVDLFFNEAIEPGSVFKTFVYANALNDGKLKLDSTYQSGKYDYKVNGRLIKAIRDHNEGKGWGTISYREGYYRSSNVAICQILTKYVDKESLIQDFKDLGLFQSSKIDGIASAPGYPGYVGENKNLEWLTTGFGQGSSVTGLQLLRGYSAFANDGKFVQPYLVDKIVNPNTGEIIYEGTSEFSKQIYSTSTVKKMRDLMSGVVNQGGTGSAYKMDDIHLIGKTGTGQVAKDGRYLSDYNTHGFVGLAPYDDPQIVIVLWYQNSITGNTSSAKLVQAVTRTALNKLNEQPTVEVETSTYVLDSYMNQSVSYVSKQLSKNQLSPVYIGDGNIVIDQYPRANIEVSSNSRVFLRTNGSEVTMPSMIGWSRKEVEAFANMAQMTIEFDGLGRVSEQSVTKGTILTPDLKIKVKASEKTIEAK